MEEHSKERSERARAAANARWSNGKAPSKLTCVRCGRGAALKMREFARQRRMAPALAFTIAVDNYVNNVEKRHAKSSHKHK